MTATAETPPTSGSPHRQRIIAAAVEMTTSRGWAAVTMARLADAVGVSRQTVYNEVGGKPALAEAMILDELSRFLSIVELSFDRHAGDLVESIRDAAREVREVSQDNTLLKAIASATHGADTKLLPLLTTHARFLLDTAKAVIAERLAPYDLPLDEHRLAAAIDVVVRVVLSHVMQPSDTPATTADDIAWIAERVLRG
ncbi:MAG: TetR family transcriptional regulator [Nocardioidaceae bacterium]